MLQGIFASESQHIFNAYLVGLCTINYVSKTFVVLHSLDEAWTKLLCFQLLKMSEFLSNQRVLAHIEAFVNYVDQTLGSIVSIELSAPLL